MSTLISTSDGVPISVTTYREGKRPHVIVAPGFFQNSQSRLHTKLCQVLSAHFNVSIFDFRGHGRSGGKFSFLQLEEKDLTAVIAYIKAMAEGKPIGLLGFSMGAAVAFNYCCKNNDIHSVVLVSIPASAQSLTLKWWRPEFWRIAVRTLVNQGSCRMSFSSIFQPKNEPMANIGQFSNVPVCFLHGDHDVLVTEKSSQFLYGHITHDTKCLHLIENGTHGEFLFEKSPEKIGKILNEWFDQTLS